jgi:MFS superfamily sulfate permease-like transporter
MAGKANVREPLRTIVLGLLVLLGAYLALAVYEAMPHFSVVIGGK